MEMNEYIDMEEIENLINIISDVPGYVSGTIKDSGHYFTLVYVGTSIFCSLANKATINDLPSYSSYNVKTEIPIKWDKEDMTNRVKEIIEIGNTVFKYVPEKYWKNFLSLKY